MPTLLLIRGSELTDSEHRLLEPQWQVLDQAVPVVARLEIRASMRTIVQQAVQVGRKLPDVEVVYHEQSPIRIGSVRAAPTFPHVAPELKTPPSSVAKTPTKDESFSWWELLQSGNFEAARGALQESALGRSDQAAARRLLDSEEVRVLVFVVELIGRQRWINFVLPLRLKLRHQRPDVRLAALRALQLISVPSALPYVELLLDDPDHQVASLAARVVETLSR